MEEEKENIFIAALVGPFLNMIMPSGLVNTLMSKIEGLDDQIETSPNLIFGVFI